ncbi:hypothetical protein CSOJ01_04954 [Colletotrichum sojae]|uniref:Uncharacterized protein n=1 Tax=Colletotrichum sojae TaxID=2175907 RepID=A0A8H6JHQ9_9PEZI|nr:hypothetical protein CSOJ01_04954 [Colletotrichum sojae]
MGGVGEEEGFGSSVVHLLPLQQAGSRCPPKAVAEDALYSVESEAATPPIHRRIIDDENGDACFGAPKRERESQREQTPTWVGKIRDSSSCPRNPYHDAENPASAASTVCGSGGSLVMYLEESGPGSVMQVDLTGYRQLGCLAAGDAPGGLGKEATGGRAGRQAIISSLRGRAAAACDFCFCDS